MNFILLSGGSGQRLWPLSNDARSKQFLNVLEHNGEKVSMLQRVWNQLKENDLTSQTLIATSHSQVDMITNQVGSDIPLIVEPERRDTFPAIALAATYLYSIDNKSLEDVVAVLPVDPYVEADFFNKITNLEDVLKNSNSDLGLVGIEPTFPSSKYGYIVPSSLNDDGTIKVSHFREKPSPEIATDLIEKGALWNAGVFAFKLRTIINALEKRGLPTSYKELHSVYSSLPKISFDFEVVEKMENIIAIPYNGYWKDLGTWNTLTDEMSSKIIGKGIVSDNSENVHIVNELNLPIVALGLKNIIIATSADGILITDKSASPKIKELVQGINQRPMYEERRWGWYQVIDNTIYEDGNATLTKKITVFPQKNLSYQYHETRDEVWTIVKGTGEFILDGEISSIKAGDTVKIPAFSKHSLKAITELQLIEIQTGFNLVEEDNCRLIEDWKDILIHCKQETL